MIFSLNEMEATAKRATRGAGYSWGQAEEAAKATRWLCQQGLDGARTLARLFERGLASDPKAHHPLQIDSPWQNTGDLCPLFAGPLLSDSARLLKTGPIEIRDIAAPALLLPFASYAANILQEVLKVDMDGVPALTDGDRLAAPNELPVKAHKVIVSLGDMSIPPRAQVGRAYPAPQDWDILNRFAHRTYVPATEESRLLGAGSDLSDND